MVPDIYEVRIFERRLTKVPHYDISMLKKRNTKKSKKTQFCCTLKLINGELHVDKERRKGCMFPNDIWNNSNYINLSKAIFVWFVDNVKSKGGFSTDDTTVFWHLKKTERLGDRYTLYDCSPLFVKANLEHYAKLVSQMALELN